MSHHYETLIGGPVTSFEDPRSRTRLEFIAIEHLSLSSFHKLQKLGLGPEEISPPGTRLYRISAQAHAAWRAWMRELANTEAAKLEAERRSVTAKIAGDLAAASPLHVSKINGQKKRQRLLKGDADGEAA
jgi:hypothetical protein